LRSSPLLSQAGALHIYISCRDGAPVFTHPQESVSLLVHKSFSYPTILTGLSIHHLENVLKWKLKVPSWGRDRRTNNVIATEQGIKHLTFVRRNRQPLFPCCRNVFLEVNYVLTVC